MEQRLTVHKWLLPALLLLACLIFYSRLFPFHRHDGILQGKDLRGYTYPYFDFLSKEVRAGHGLPLWNPHQMAGFSIIGSGEVNLFYPPNWFIYIRSVRQTVTANVILHTFIGMWGVAFLARQLGCSRFGSLTAGLLWGGCGFIGARLEAGHYTLLLPMAWLPWVVGAYQWSLKRGTWRAGLAGAAAFGLMALAGHPQIALLAGLTLTIMWGFVILRDPAHFKKATRPLVVIVLFGTLLGAVGILPVVETARVSERNAQDDRFAFADQFSMPANQLVTFVFPFALGDKDTIKGDPNFEELFAYIGLLPLIALVLLMQRPTTETWLLLLIGGLGLVLSLAMDGGLLRLGIQLLPQLGVFRSAGRYLALTQIALACLTGQWITQVQTASVSEREQSMSQLTRHLLPRLIMLLFGGAFLLSFGRAFSTSVIEKPEQLWVVAQVIAKTGLILLLLGLALQGVQKAGQKFQQALGVLVLIALLDVWSASLSLIPVGTKATYDTFWETFEAVIPQNEADLHRIMIDPRRYRALNNPTGLGYYDIYGYEQLSANTYSRWTADGDPLSMRNRLLGVRYVVTREALDEESLNQGGLKLLSEQPDDQLYFYEFTEPVARAFLARVAVVQKDNDAVRHLFADKLFADPKIVLLAEDAPCLQRHYEGGAVNITDYQPNSVELDVNSQGVGLLFLSDRYADGWQVTVNGVRRPIYRADTTFRAVCVPDGHSQVVFTYRPLSLYVGGLLSGLAWSLVLLVAGYTWIKRGVKHGA